MRKLIAIAVAAIMTVALFAFTVNADESIRIDFNTEEGRAMGTFFGEGCEYSETEKWATGDRVSAYLINQKNGGDATPELGLYDNGIEVKFNAGSDGFAEFKFLMVCPDQPYGAGTYSLRYSLNGADFVQDMIPQASGSIFEHTINNLAVKAGENSIKLVQGAYQADRGNAWRIDILEININITAEEVVIPLEDKVVDIYTSLGGGDPQQLNAGPIAIVITVPEGYALAEVIGVDSPTWSNPEGGSCAIAKVYPWKGDYDSSIAAGALATSEEIIDHADNANAVYKFDNQVKAGDYLVEFTSTGTKAIGFWTYSAVEGDHPVFQNGQPANFYPKSKMSLVVAQAETEPVTGGEEETSFLKAVSRDQLTVDNADRAKFGGNSEVTDVDLKADVGKELRIWGWLGTTSPITGFGYKINGGDVVTGDFAVAPEGPVVDAAKAKGATEASRYAIMVPITADNYKIEAVVITEAGTEVIWTVNVTAAEEVPQTGDISVAMFAVIAVLALGATVVFKKKREF